MVSIIGLFFVLGIVSPAHTDTPTLVITEIGAFESIGQEWIELYNVSNESIDLTGWKFWEEGTNHGITAPSGTSYLLSPQSYALIVQDMDQFLIAYPTTTVPVFDSSWGSLNLSGEEIGMRNASGTLVETITYIETPNDRSLERIDPYTLMYSRDNWRAHPTSATPGAQNFWFLDYATDAPVAIISGPTSSDQFTTSTFDGSGSYGIGQLHYSWRMFDTTIGTDAFLTYRFDVTGTVALILDVTDSRPMFGTAQSNIVIHAASSTEGSPTTSTSIAMGMLAINEFVSRPASGDNEWIELMNLSSTTVTLSGITIEDGVDTIATPTGTITAGSFKHVRISGSKLNNSGDRIAILSAGEIIDDIAYGNWEGAKISAPGTSEAMARTPNGTGTFARTTAPTPGAANSIIAPASSSGSGGGSSTFVPAITEQLTIGIRDIVINELVSDPESGEGEWVELYNTTDRTISLSSLVLAEGSGANTTITGTMLPHGYLVISPISGNLNNAGDTVFLKTTAGTIIDLVTYGDWQSAQESALVAKKGQSLARIVDGEDSDRHRIDWTVTDTPTKGLKNRIIVQDDTSTTTSSTVPIEKSTVATVDPNTNIRITALLPNPSGDETMDEYITLTNLGISRVDLTGWLLGDATKSKYILPDISVDAQASVRILRSDSGIALNNTGTEVVTLYTPDDSVHDTITYTGPAPEDVPYTLIGTAWQWGTTVDDTTSGTYKFGDLVVYIDTPTVVGVPIAFDASDSDLASGTAVSWLFADGTTYTGHRIEHVFSSSGETTVTVQLTDIVGTVLTSHTVPVTVVERSAQLLLGVAPRAGSIIISEVAPNPEGDDMAEYIELYNPGSTDIMLAGLMLDDAEGGSRPYIIPTGTSIAGGAHLVFRREDTKLALNNTGDMVRLLFSDGRELTSINFDTAKEGMVYVRTEDGTYTWSDVGSPGAVQTAVLAGLPAGPTVAGAFVSSVDIALAETTIEDLASYPVGAMVSVSGFVASLPGVLGSQLFYLVDESAAGVQVYLYNKEFPELREGDHITVTGEITMNGRERRIKLRSGEDIQLLGSGALPDPKTLEISQMSDIYSGWFMGIDAEITEVKSTYLYIDDGTAELKVYIKKGTNIPTPTYAVGELVRVIGILVPTGDGLQLLPRSVDDIITTGMSSRYDSDSKVASIPKARKSYTPDNIFFAVLMGVGSIIIGLVFRQYGGQIRVGVTRIVRRIRS